MKQNEAVINALEQLGGVATLGQINQEAMNISDCKWNTKTPFASIRRIVQLDKNIYKIKPGLYGLIKFKKENEAKGIFAEDQKNKNSKEIQDFNHSYYQGLLLTVGNLKNLKTFIPDQDKNKVFVKTKLGEIRTLETIPQFSYPNFIQRSSSIDVIWFNDRNMPHSFFEVEHSTNIQNSLLKFNDLQDFHSRMVIVADSCREKEYMDKIRYYSFNNLVKDKRVSFLSYESLNKQYESEIQKQNFEFIL